MKKILQTIALVALMALPWAASAQGGCTIRVTGVDSWGDGWNGGSLDIAQGGTTLQTFTLSTGSTGEVTVTLPTDDPVTFTWSSGSYDSEVTINIYDGGNTLVYNVSTPSAGVIYTMSSPCPSCLPPTNLVASSITSDGMTVSWTDATNTGDYTLSYWLNGDDDTISVSLTDTSYSLSGLEANSTYYFSVVTVCSASEESTPLTGAFKTDCLNGSCELTAYVTDSYNDSWNGCAINIVQGGTTVATIECPSGQSGSTFTYAVCSGDTVTLTFTRGSYPNEMGGYVTDGAGITAFTIENMGNYQTGNVLATLANPCPTCIPPMALTIDSTMIDQIDFSWTPRSGATLFAVYLNDSLVDDNVPDTSYSFTGLDANTPYTLGVRSICTSDDSSNVVSINARTSCGAMTLPFFVDFEDAAYNGAWYPCWDSTIHAGTDPSVNNQPSYSSYNHTPGGTYAMYLQGNSSENYNLVVGPEMIVAGDEISVSFWAFVNSGSWIKAGVITNPRDTSTFIPLVTVSGNSWTEYEFNTAALDPAANYRVAWLAYGSGYIGKFDDVNVSVYSGCGRPATASVDSVTGNSAELSWMSVNGVSSYIVYYGTVNDVEDADVQSVVVNDTAVSLTGLTGMTQYYAWVASVCGSGTSDVRPFGSFATACEDATCTFTAHVTDSYDDSWNGCAINIEQAGVTVATIVCPSGQSGSTFTYDVCSTAPVSLTFTRGSYPNELGGYVTDGGGNTVFTIENMSNYPDGSILATLATPCPDCITPTDFYLSDTTATGVTLHWTAQEDQSSWIVRIDSNEFSVTDTFYVVSGLSPRTAHVAMVATDCSDDTSNFLSLPFVTGCAGEACEITVSSTNDYLSYSSYYSDYSPTLSVRQNGVELASVQSSTETIGVCSDMPLTVILTSEGTSYVNPTATIVNGGDEELFNGTTTAYSAGDTLVNVTSACPTCLKPTGVVASTIDSTELTFQWDIEPGYIYLISFDGSAFTPNTVASYTAYGLLPNTLHTFAVKTVCMAGDTSSVREISVRTSCSGMTIPYFEGFENAVVDEAPTCWTVTTAGATGYPKVTNGGNTGSHDLSMVSNSGTPSLIATSAIPLPGDSIFVSFYATVYSSLLEVGMMTNPYIDSTFIPMVTINGGYNDPYTLYEFNTNTLNSGSTYYLAFRHTASGTYYSAQIDDINIRLDEGCITPTNVIATPDTTTSHVTVSWTYTGSLNDFVVQYRTVGTDWSTPSYTSNTSYTVNGLAYATTYEFRVGQLCGNDTLWGAPAMATTICQLINLPYFENFNSATGELPPCWDYTAPNSFHWNRWTTHAETSGDGEMMAGSFSAGDAAILPAFYAPLIKLEISFDAKLGNISEGDGMMMGAYNESTGMVEWLDTLTNPGQSRENFVRFTYNYLNYSGNGTRIAIGHSHNHSSDWGFALDSIIVIELNNCNPPENLTANNTMYPNTADDVYFTWTASSGDHYPSGYQLYFDTITSTIDIDSVPENQLITVDTNYYMPAINTLAEGAHYRLFVRSVCSNNVHSNWVELQNGFSTDEFWMNDTSSFDTIVGCDFIIYDNGGPVAGYLHNSNSNLVIQAGEEGRELQLQGGFFSHGDDANTFTVYDGVGTAGTVLYMRNNTSMSETIDSVLATSTTGAMTITFTSGYFAALGYELYIHCIGDASCLKPTNLQVEMTGDGEATATWDSTGATLYRVYHHTSGDSVWNMLPTYTNSITFTGLPADVTYDFYVVAHCSDSNVSAPSIIRHFNTHYEAPCDGVSDLQVSNLSQTSATIGWTSTGSLWDVEINGTTVRTAANPYNATGLTSNTQYIVRVRTVCDTSAERYSVWSDTINFTSIPVTYTISVVSNNEDWGTVTGSGDFTEGTATTIKATANDGYHFVKWLEDGNMQSERTIIVNADATYTAIFADNTGIADVESANVTLYPNPASTAVTIRGIEGEATVSVVDLNGHTMGEWRVESGEITLDINGYAKGAYFIRITGERSTAIRKLIVK